MGDKYPDNDKDDFNVLPENFHTGGKIEPSEQPLIGSQGVDYVGPTVTGRWSGRCPERSQEPRKIAIIAHGSSAAVAVARMVVADYSEIEKRVMAQMAVPERLLGKKR